MLQFLTNYADSCGFPGFCLVSLIRWGAKKIKKNHQSLLGDHNMTKLVTNQCHLIIPGTMHAKNSSTSIQTSD